MLRVPTSRRMRVAGTTGLTGVGSPKVGDAEGELPNPHGYRQRPENRRLAFIRTRNRTSAGDGDDRFPDLEAGVAVGARVTSCPYATK
jgi:hypothetical protein